MQEPHGASEPLNKYHYSIGTLRCVDSHPLCIILLSEVMDHEQISVEVLFANKLFQQTECHIF